MNPNITRKNIKGTLAAQILLGPVDVKTQMDGISELHTFGEDVFLQKSCRIKGTKITFDPAVIDEKERKEYTLTPSLRLRIKYF